jgi:hypothetical protein
MTVANDQPRTATKRFLAYGSRIQPETAGRKEKAFGINMSIILPMRSKEVQKADARPIATHGRKKKNLASPTSERGVAR